MATAYRRKVSSGNKSRLPTYGLLVFLSFVGGYWCATMVDYAQIKQWLNTPVLANRTNPSGLTSVIQPAQLPKPKLEFYTLLTHTPANTAPVTAPPRPATTQVNLPEAQQAPVQVAQPTLVASTPSATANKEAYWVQIAAFKRRDDADRMKGELILKGFDVTIMNPSSSQMNWYRVMIGPFLSHEQAQKAQLIMVNSEHITGMIRKIS